MQQAKMEWAQQAINKYDWHCLVVNMAAVIVGAAAFGSSMRQAGDAGTQTFLVVVAAIVVVFVLWMISGYYQHLKNLYVARYKEMENGQEATSLVVEPSLGRAVREAIWQPPVSWLFYALICILAVRGVLFV